MPAGLDNPARKDAGYEHTFGAFSRRAGMGCHYPFYACRAGGVLWVNRAPEKYSFMVVCFRAHSTAFMAHIPAHVAGGDASKLEWFVFCGAALSHPVQFCSGGLTVADRAVIFTCFVDILN